MKNKDIGVGSVLIRSDNYFGSMPKGFVGIVDRIIKAGESITFVKFKGMGDYEYCLDNFKLSNNRKKDLKRAYQFLIDRCKYQIKMYRDEMKRELKPVDETKFLFTKQDFIDSGIDIK